MYVGVDLAVVAAHQAWVFDDQLERLGEHTFEPTASAIAGFVDWLFALADGRQFAVGLESPHGAVVEALLDRSVPVFHINPKKVDRFRERESVSGAKDDRRDARVIARALSTDFPCFQEVVPNAPEIVRLRELSRERDVIVEERKAHANRLRDQLLRFFPHSLKLCGAADERWFWELLSVAPSPVVARELKARSVQTILNRRKIRRLTATQILEILREPAISVADGMLEACVGRVTRLIAVLEAIDENLRQVEADLRRTLTRLRESEGSSQGKGEHRDIDILLSMPGVGEIVGATVLAEASAALQARDYSILRTTGGVAPVTKASGKRRKKHAIVGMRQACNQRLRNALHHWAAGAATTDDAAKRHYQELKAKGMTRGRALRGVADRLLRILVAALKSGRLYDPACATHSPYSKAA